MIKPYRDRKVVGVFVRFRAPLQQPLVFSTDNNKTDEPYSVIEDVFVPFYIFLHRFQTAL
jgi:hypothetical protein